jgi:D-glycero-alpha-D-manno-heptose 1-phosphate guanylyltransferase
MNFKEAIILAGGLGTRLRSAVPELPKCMAPILAKPFIGYLLDYLLQQGIERFILSLGYKSQVIEQYIDTQYGHINRVYSVEEEPLGTGGAIRLAAGNAETNDVLVVNGDTFFRCDISKLAGFHLMCGADCTLCLKPMKHFDRYGMVELNKDYSISGFHEKQYYAEGLVNGGVYALNVKRFLKESLPVKFSFEKDYLEVLHKQRRMFGMIQDAYFIDIGIPSDFEKAQTELIVNI